MRARAMRVPLTAELAKQRGQRAPLAWDFLAVPAFATFLALALEAALPAAGGAHLAASVYPIRSGIRILSLACNPFAQLFYAIGAAAFLTVGSPRDLAADRAAPQPRRLAGGEDARLRPLRGREPRFAPRRRSRRQRRPSARPRDRDHRRPTRDMAQSGARLPTSSLELVAFGGTVALLAVVTAPPSGLLCWCWSCVLAGLEAMLNISGDALVTLPLPTFAADAIRSWIDATAENRVRPARPPPSQPRRSLAGASSPMEWRPSCSAARISRPSDPSAAQNGILKPGGSWRPPVTSSSRPARPRRPCRGRR